MLEPNKSLLLTLCGLALVLTFFLSAAGGCKKKQPPPPPPPPTPTPVIPPGSLVFVQRGHLARFDLEGSQITPLTGGKSTEWFPACSPKGDQVVYWSNADPANKLTGVGVYNLWKINLDGTSRIQLTYDQTNSLRTGDQNLLLNAAPSWSPDGKRVLYTLEGDIWIMDSDGFNPETVLTDHSALCPVLSPDGKTVIFISNAEDSVYNIWSVAVSDKVVKKITNYTDWNVGSPSFSADGRRILFNLYRANTTQVYTVNAADGSDPVNLTKDNRSLCPKYAIFDRKIVFCSYGTGEDVGLNLFIMNPNATEMKALTTEGGTSPSWAPARILASSPTPAAAPASQTSSSIPLPTPVGK